MDRVETGNFNQLSYKAGGGCVSLFGLPFFGFGVAFMIAGIMGTVKSKTGAPVGPVFPVLFGGFFASIGAVFLFGRAGVIFDKSAGTATQWWGLFFPMWKTYVDLNSCGKVTISREVRKSKNSSTTVFPVRVSGPAKPINITEPRDEIEARRYAEEVAKFLELGIIDSSGAEVVERAAGTLDESLRDRIRREGIDVDITSPPPQMRAAFEAHGNAVVFDMRPTPFSLGLLVPFIGIGIFVSFVVAIFLYPILTDSKMEPAAKMFFTGFIGIFFVFLPLAGTFFAMIGALTRRWEVEADPVKLRVTTRGMFLSKTTEIQCDELEELQVLEPLSKDKTKLRAISDKATITFGEGYARVELEWIRKVILKAITA